MYNYNICITITYSYMKSSAPTDQLNIDGMLLSVHRDMNFTDVVVSVDLMASSPAAGPDPKMLLSAGMASTNASSIPGACHEPRLYLGPHCEAAHSYRCSTTCC